MCVCRYPFNVKHQNWILSIISFEFSSFFIFVILFLLSLLSFLVIIISFFPIHKLFLFLSSAFFSISFFFFVSFRFTSIYLLSLPLMLFRLDSCIVFEILRGWIPVEYFRLAGWWWLEIVKRFSSPICHNVSDFWTEKRHSEYERKQNEKKRRKNKNRKKTRIPNVPTPTVYTDISYMNEPKKKETNKKKRELYKFLMSFWASFFFFVRFLHNILCFM